MLVWDLYDRLAREMLRHSRDQDNFLPSIHIRHTKKDRTTNETMELIMGTSKADVWREERRSLLVPLELVLPVVAVWNEPPQAGNRKW